MDNHFALFQMPVSFDIDIGQLDSAFRELQGRVHPDRFAAASDAEKRVAMQWATRANEAYQTLKNPLKRAAYLCELNGVDLGIESNTAMPPAFLMQQMEWREQLEDSKDAKDIEALEKLYIALRAQARSMESELCELLDVKQDYAAATELTRKLIFVDKVCADIQQAIEYLD